MKCVRSYRISGHFICPSRPKQLDILYTLGNIPVSMFHACMESMLPIGQRGKFKASCLFISITVLITPSDS